MVEELLDKYQVPFSVKGGIYKINITDEENEHGEYYIYIVNKEKIEFNLYFKTSTGRIRYLEKIEVEEKELKDTIQKIKEFIKSSKNKFKETLDKIELLCKSTPILKNDKEEFSETVCFATCEVEVDKSYYGVETIIRNNGVVTRYSKDYDTEELIDELYNLQREEFSSVQSMFLSL